MSAGFEHVALYERIRKRANTLKANWPTWPVRCADLRNVPDAELARYHGIDLLAGGISSNMASRQSKKDKRGQDDDLVPELLRAVRVVQPRAFMIESARGFAFEAPRRPSIRSLYAMLCEMLVRDGNLTGIVLHRPSPEYFRRLMLTLPAEFVDHMRYGRGVSLWDIVHDAGQIIDDIATIPTPTHSYLGT